MVDSDMELSRLQYLLPPLLSVIADGFGGTASTGGVAVGFLPGGVTGVGLLTGQ
jgi:hypothetical protein